MPRNAVFVVTDSRQFPVAAYQAARIRALVDPAEVDFVIASDSEEDFRRAAEFGLSFVPLPIEAALAARQYPVNASFITPASYFRLYVPRLVSERYDRLLYVDTDVYFHDARFVGLFGLDMAGHAIAAVRDTLPHYADDVAVREFTRTGTLAHRHYFNNGVMLIDVAAYLASDIERRTIAYVESGAQLTFNEQSAMNAVMNGDWLELSPAFNLLVEYWTSFVREVCPPVIAHFAGPVKPWLGPNFNITHPMRRELEAFISASPWKGFLSKYYSVGDALAAVGQHRPKLPPPPTIRRGSPLERNVVTYLRTTRFADVVQGVTGLNLDRLP
jgi:lipopolysaccharide biosynthesis glycosyltransferase